MASNGVWGTLKVVVGGGGGGGLKWGLGHLKGSRGEGVASNGVWGTLKVVMGGEGSQNRRCMAFGCIWKIFVYLYGTVSTTNCSLFIQFQYILYI